MCAKCLELRLQVDCAGSLRTTPADEQQVLSAAARKPARHVGTNAAGGTGDKHSALRPPRERLSATSRWRAHQTPSEHTRAAHRNLILVVQSGEHAAHPSTGSLVQDRRQIEETAPTSGLLQAEHTGE